MEHQPPLSRPSRLSIISRLISGVSGWPLLLKLLVGFIALVAFVYAEENWRGKRAWENYQRQLKARGVELNWHAFAPPPVPDNQNFAMTPFLAPLLDFNPKPLLPDQSPFRDISGYNRATGFANELWPKSDNASRYWPEGRMTDLQAVLTVLHKGTNSATVGKVISTRADAAGELLLEYDRYKPVLDEIRIAINRPYSRFNISYDDEDPWEILLPHLGVLRKISRIMCLHASAELELGKTEAAMEDIRLIFSLAHSIHDEPMLISHLVRISILKNAEQIIWEGLAGHHWSDQQLQNFEVQLDRTSILKDFDLPMRVERAVGNATFELLRNDRRNFQTFMSQRDDSLAFFFHFIPRGWIYEEQVSYNRLLDTKVLPGVDFMAGQMRPQIMDAGMDFIQNSGKSGGELIWHHCIIARMILPPLGKAAQKTAYAQIETDETALACALERYRLAKGEFPEALAVLSPQFIQAMPHDVFPGVAFVYHRKENGQFVLYSVGWNESDDGGEAVLGEDGKAIDLTQGDWVWPAYPGN